jgi:hypothetical protein
MKQTKKQRANNAKYIFIETNTLKHEPLYLKKKESPTEFLFIFIKLIHRLKSNTDIF